MKSSFFEELKWRGLLFQFTEGAEKFFAKPTTFYWGMDLTADSLHVGQLLGLILMKRAIAFGHQPLILIASGTTMVGDPSGKEKERPILTREEIENNKQAIKKQVENILKGEKVKIFDNFDWLSKLGLLEFLRDAGKYITLNSMLDKESVKTRLERKSGISFAEFSYQLLQAYDFLYFFEKEKCPAQMAGSDQWGNMVQGVDLIRKKLGQEAAAVSWPLVEDPETGKKFGKSAVGKTIWLDGQKTSPFEFYQFFINIEDSMIVKLFKCFSFKEEKEILELEEKWNKEKEKRLLQKELAFELTSLVHGKEEAQKAQKASENIFNKEKARPEFLEEEAVLIDKDLKTLSLQEALIISGAVSSSSAAWRLVKQGGGSLEVIDQDRAIVRKGKKNIFFLKRKK